MSSPSVLVGRALLGSLLLLVATPAQIFVQGGVSPHWGSPNFADLNGDGAPDDAALVTRGGPGQDSSLHVVMNDGMGFMPSPRLSIGLHPSLRAACGLFTSPTLIDLDQDGHVDAVARIQDRFLVATGSCPRRACVFWNDGRGNLVPDDGSAFHGIPMTISIFDATDMDADGDVDLVVIGLDPATSTYHYYLLRNDGTSNWHFDGSAAFPITHDGRSRLADVNGDGTPDLVAASLSRGTSRIHLNDGTGRFGPGFVFPSNAMQAGVADLDADGDLDVLFGIPNNAAGQPGLELWLNDGAGSFRLAPERFVNPTWQATNSRLDTVFGFHDIDLDGDIDILEWNGWDNMLWRNDGRGYFSEDPAALGPIRDARAFSIDLDRDGDVDAINWTPFGGYHWVNLTRHLFVNDPPIGGSLDVDIHADPGHTVGFILGFVRRDYFLPRIGWLALDPTFSAAFPSVRVVPSSRQVRLSMPVPSDPSLRGLQLYAQSFGIPPNDWPYLGNVANLTIR